MSAWKNVKLIDLDHDDKFQLVEKDGALYAGSFGGEKNPIFRMVKQAAPRIVVQFSHDIITYDMIVHYIHAVHDATDTPLIIHLNTIVRPIRKQ